MRSELNRKASFAILSCASVVAKSKTTATGAVVAEHYEPPDPHYREWATGAVRLELHSITGAWEEFRAELAASPELAADVLGWICPENDWQYASVQEAKRIAMSTEASRQSD